MLQKFKILKLSKIIIVKFFKIKIWAYFQWIICSQEFWNKLKDAFKVHVCQITPLPVVARGFVGHVKSRLPFSPHIFPRSGCFFLHVICFIKTGCLFHVICFIKTVCFKCCLFLPSLVFKCFVLKKWFSTKDILSNFFLYIQSDVFPTQLWQMLLTLFPFK